MEPDIMYMQYNYNEFCVNIINSFRRMASTLGNIIATGIGALAAAAAIYALSQEQEETRHNRQEQEARHNRQEEECFSEHEAAQIALSEDHVTHLLTNEGRLYRSESNPSKHAEVILTRKTQARNITKIWIKNSPCAQCSRVLIQFFNNCRKPIIYVGRIYRPDNQEDHEGLMNLVQQGFELNVWETFHTMKHDPYSRKTHNYLRDVKQKAYNPRPQNSDCIIS